MKSKLIFVVFLVIGASTSAFSQFSLVKESPTLEELEKSKLLLKPMLHFGLLNYVKPEHSYHPTLGAFCVLENKIAKKATFPVKMRLGSVDYVDKLENKRN